MKYARIEQIIDLLTILGFSQTKPDHFLFEHDESETTIMLPSEVEEGWVADQDIDSIRHHLHEKGLLPSKKFDKLVRRSEAPIVGDS